MKTVLFTGTAHPQLASAIADRLGIPLGSCSVEKFPDGEVSVRLHEPVRNRDVFIVQPTSPPVNDHLIELIAFADAARRAAAARITAVIPYFGYARSDKRGHQRDPIMASAVAKMLESCGIDHVITLDPHSPQIEGYFHVPVDAWSAVPVLAAAIRDRVPGDAVIVAPDAGALRIAMQYGELLDRDVVALHKRRTSATRTVVTHVVGDVFERRAIVIDDMISTGGTMVRSIEALLGAGARFDITIVATHGLLLDGCTHRLDIPPVREVIVTDSIPLQWSWPRLHVVSIAPLLAQAIARAAGMRALLEKPALIETTTAA